jgi:hypothetical protein
MTAIKTNLKNYLNYYRILTDAVNILKIHLLLILALNLK